MDRHQRQVQISNPHQDTVQRGLIGEGTTQHCFAIFLMAQAQALEPGGPTASYVTLNSDFVECGCTHRINLPGRISE
jgi:hypothetical protein